MFDADPDEKRYNQARGWPPAEHPEARAQAAAELVGARSAEIATLAAQADDLRAEVARARDQTGCR